MLETGAQLGPYRLLRRIGAGGMAEVFLAQRIGAEGFARTVAIKTILAVGAEEEGISLFLDEARVAGYLEHAAIVQTVDLGFENDTLFIVMEYVPGPALSRVIRDLKKSGRFVPPEAVAYIGARVASALDYAHRRATTPDGKHLKLVHRDISPQNILLTRSGMVKLTDFGVARASVQTHKTRTGQVRGKAAYMAPEQVRAGQLDGRTDIFALALVLYEALTGVRAYQRKTDIMSMRAILTDEVAPIKDVNPSVPDDLVAVIKKALSKKPNDRYAHASEMAEALMATYRSHSEAVIESEITGIINELFGPEQFSSSESGMPVEAWQPTISAQAAGEGSNPTPHRISGAKLSPKIAALLQPPTPATPHPAQVVERGSWEDGVPGPESDSMHVALTPAPQHTPSAVAYAGIARPAGYAPHDGEVPSLPGNPVMGQTQARGPAGYAAGTGVMAPDPVAFGEVVHAPPGYSLPNTGMGMAPVAGTPSNGTSAILFTDASAVRPRAGRAIMWSSGVIGSLMVVAVGYLAWSHAHTTKPVVPAKSAVEARATTANGEGERAVASDQPASVRVESRKDVRSEPQQPRSAAAATLEAADPKEAREAREAAERQQHARAAAAAAAAAKKSEAQHAQQQAKNEAQHTAASNDGAKGKSSVNDFIARAIAAKKRAGIDADLQRDLTKLINDLTIAPREITHADLELVKRAEAK